MPIERYKVGRLYTRRERARADFADPEAVREVMNDLASRDYTVEGRLADAERRAEAYLKRANMPLDLRAGIYGDSAWLRSNERKSLVWYAINILNTIRMLRRQIERGDASLAADLALDLGELFTEAKFIQELTGKQAEGGRAPREEVAQRHAEWRREAERMWERHPKWSTTRVAWAVARAFPSLMEHSRRGRDSWCIRRG
jgi:hypothetical protein